MIKIPTLSHGSIHTESSSVVIAVQTLAYEGDFQISTGDSSETNVQMIPAPETPSDEGRTQLPEMEIGSTAGSTYFSSSEVQFASLENGDIEMSRFLRTCRGIVGFVEFLGTVFIPVKDDIQANITKVEYWYQLDAQKFASIKKLLDAEIIDWPNRMGPGTEALLWLKRALEFVCVFLEQIVADHVSGKKSTKLVPMAKEAYQQTLAHHHGTIQRLLFKGIIHATPSRKDFLRKVAAGRTNAEDDCIVDMERYVQPMKANVNWLVQMYKELGFEK